MTLRRASAPIAWATLRRPGSAPRRRLAVPGMAKGAPKRAERWVRFEAESGFVLGLGHRDHLAKKAGHAEDGVKDKVIGGPPAPPEPGEDECAVDLALDEVSGCEHILPSPKTAQTSISEPEAHNGAPGSVTVKGNVKAEASLAGRHAFVEYEKEESGTFKLKDKPEVALPEKGIYVDSEGVGVGKWRVRAVFGTGQLRSVRLDVPRIHDQQQITAAVPQSNRTPSRSPPPGWPGTPRRRSGSSGVPRWRVRGRGARRAGRGAARERSAGRRGRPARRLRVRAARADGYRPGPRCRPEPSPALRSAPAGRPPYAPRPADLRWSSALGRRPTSSDHRDPARLAGDEGADPRPRHRPLGRDGREEPAGGHRVGEEYPTLGRD